MPSSPTFGYAFITTATELNGLLHYMLGYHSSHLSVQLIAPAKTKVISTLKQTAFVFDLMIALAFLSAEIKFHELHFGTLQLWECFFKSSRLHEYTF
jgi:hypothetical protein